ncbi:hypothetical protein EZJ49_09520 [Bdellovibrio bacteriovorus]|uniref:hypothetical protein n=1 Tax=Bdellovibrio bacteriovorus TaxID=959 RepID=UPI0021CFA9A4|nr:hypothetical protein [Bdellovibrio bacteriovorus]UXR63312.1 hypothetical protein EZJ49_09520 [Bdellovibrio bacteriovorus]
MEINAELNTHMTASSIPDQVSQDIESYLLRFKDPKKGLNMLAAKSQVHVKTLNRLRERTHNPNYSTLYKLYSCLLETRDLNQLVEKVPPVVREKLQRTDPQLKSSPLHRFNFDLETDLQKDPCFTELYVLSETRPFDDHYVRDRFGSYGLTVLERMLELKVIRPLGNGLYGQGEIRSPFSAESIKSVGIRLTERFSKTANVDTNFANFMSLYFETVSEETYREWVLIEERAFKERVKLLEKPQAKGDIPVFAFTVVDTLLENEQ